MDSSDALRFVSKKFSCPICSKRFKKLVHINEFTAKCPDCGHENSPELPDSELEREKMDKTYRMNFTELSPQESAQYHPRTDIFDRNQSNIYGDPRREIPRPQQQQPQSNPQPPRQPPQPQHNHPLFSLFIPFSVSPFAGSVRRSPFNFGVFSSIFSDNYFENPIDDFFIDNFASNFTSNFFNPMTRIVFMNSMQNQHMGNPPAAKTSLSKLKKFKMGKEYCKKDEKDPSKFEYPTCSICLMDVAEGQDTILIPCGHMFHDACITKWLNLHNSCPVCRYELPTDDPEYERERSQRNAQRNQNISRNQNMRPMDFSHPENYNQSHLQSNNVNNPNNNNIPINNSNLNSQSTNINIQGEGNMRL